MMKHRSTFLYGISALILMLANSGMWADTSNHIKATTAITEVFGDGQRITAIAIEYDQAIDNSRLTASSYAVKGRTVTAAYANTEAQKAPAPVVQMGPPPASGTAQETKKLQGANGNYVILELSESDANSSLFVQNGPQATRAEAKASITQTGDIYTVEGSKYSANSAIFTNDKVENLIVEDFKQFEYKDAKTGLTLTYNLFVPKNYDKTKSYPMVLFMHDAGATSPITEMTLIQGLGAVVWASPAEQAKHECFVLAPQFSAQVVSDDNKETPYVDAVANLVNTVAGQYSIDKKRLYTTGQSGGCMMSIALDIKYPDLFAASFLVAGQWDVTKVAPLTKDKLWIVVSAGDQKAFPGMNTITATLEKQGAKVSREIWSGQSTAEEFNFNVAKMRAEETPIHYVELQRGTVVPSGMKDDAGSNHICTWRIAYTIEGIRDWLFAQSK